MTSGLSRETLRKARASRHTVHTTACECGRTLHGNGWKSHARTCPQWLERYGWPFDSDTEAALRASLRASLNYPAEATAEQFLAALRAECIAEARRRGLLDADGRATP